MIVLINPPVSEKAAFPVKCTWGLGCLKTFLSKNKIECVIIDEKNIELTIQKISELNKKVFLFGFTAMSYQINSALRLASYIKKKFPDSHVCFGGSAATGLKEKLLLNNSVDFVISGEGEIPLFTLYSCLKNGDNLGKVPALFFKNSGKINNNSFYNLLKPEELILAERENLTDYGIFFDHSFREKTAFLMFSRGCPGKCRFCMSPKIFPSPARICSVDKAVSYIKNIIDKYDIKHFVIDDDNFMFFKDFVYEFAQKIRNFKIKFRINMSIINFDPELILELKKSGLTKISAGIETLSEKSCEIIHKKTDRKKLETISVFCKKNNILFSTLFMALLPGEGVEDFCENFNFVKKLNPSGGFDFQIFQPHPGTFSDAEIKKYGFLLTDNLDEYFSDNVVFLPENIDIIYFEKIFSDKTGKAISIAGKNEKSLLEIYKNNSNAIIINPENFRADFNIECYHWTGSENCSTGLSIIKCRDYGFIEYDFSISNSENKYVLIFRGASHPIGFPEGDEFGSVVNIYMNNKLISTEFFPSIHTIGKLFEIPVLNVIKGKNTLKFEISYQAKFKNGFSIFNKALSPFYKKYETGIILKTVEC